MSASQWRLGQKNIVSPRQGLVFDTLYREGEWVAAGNPVVQLLPPENMEIRFFVPETSGGQTQEWAKTFMSQCDGCAASGSGGDHASSRRRCEYTPPVIYSNENRSKLVFMIIAKPPTRRRRCCIPASLWR